MSNIICRQAIAILSNYIYWKKLLWIPILAYFIVITNNNIIQAAAPTSPGARYEEAKKALKNLQSDSINQKLRDPWLKISDLFFKIYTSFPDWINRPFALYYSAVALDELAKHSFTVSDAEKAIKCYQSVITKYPKRTITESALLNIAKVYAERLHKPNDAKKYLQKLLTDYPKSDKINEAQIYLKSLENLKEEPQKTSTTSTSKAKEAFHSTSKQKNSHLQKKTSEKTLAQLENIRWEVKKSYLKLIITLTEPITWDVISHPANPKTGNPIRLLIELHNTIPNPCIKPGICIKQNKLEKLRVDLSTPTVTKLLLDLSALKPLKVETTHNPLAVVSTLFMGQ